MLEIKNLHASYGQLNAVKGVDITVNEGEIVFVVGPNGAGKSTLLKCVSGLLRPTSGTITFCGKSILKEQPERLCRSGLALVPEGRHIFGTLSVEENLRLAAMHRKDSAEVKKDIAWVVETFPILGKRFKGAAGYLSGGEQQQLAIARAILLKPKLMMIDEPSLGLAPLVIDQVYASLKKLNEGGMTLLVVEQSTARVLDLADEITVLRNGRVILSQSAEEGLDGQALEKAYFGYQTEETTVAALTPHLHMQEQSKVVHLKTH
ncbi:ABC transporter ATP-binding protein [Glaciimonas sp. PCH181]|uniref:ABC transporter ATP-binding protein n=1 Tax=Glaciimonas sp. PCH181 TaxID=2133943 RepID=UPI000D3B0A66|nr:ABC transporter ATP-binding protein [Glaciimonas sp. PCH181]PUA20404.1 ABC transporter ATP-binding protein [Glaciimonas sp. PCH181]